MEFESKHTGPELFKICQKVARELLDGPLKYETADLLVQVIKHRKLQLKQCVGQVLLDAWCLGAAQVLQVILEDKLDLTVVKRDLNASEKSPQTPQDAPESPKSDRRR